MPTHYHTPLTFTLLLTSSMVLTAYAQKSALVKMQYPQPINSTQIQLTDFTLPPHPVELLDFNLNAEGRIHFQTLMPIAGRIAATTDEAKLKGALAQPAGVYLYSATVEAQGQVPPAPGSVFGQPDARVKLAADTPVDWAVWGTSAKDGPRRLPYGGGLEALPASLQPTRQVRQLMLAVSGSGLNYANYSLYPQYRLMNRYVDPMSYRLMNRLEETTPQQAANQQKLARYIPVEGETPWQRGQVITLSPTGSSHPRFEGLATRFVEGDKNASARQVSLLTFDDAGNLLNDQPVTFPYNRKLSMRLPVHDDRGKVVGSFSLFADGGGKKDGRDPQENRFSVVVTDEQGNLWSQFEWINGEGSSRAIIPTYVQRKGDNLLVYSTNQQKLLKPAEESWLIDKAGKATLVGSIPGNEVTSRSTDVIDAPTGVVSASQRQGTSTPGWANYSGAHYLDSFTDAQNDVWVLLQRQTDAAGGSASTPSPSAASTTGRLMGFANKLNQLAGLAPQAATPAPAATESGKVYGDVFVLHLDKDLRLKEQAVVRLEPGSQPLRVKRSLRATGADYVFNNSATIRLSLRTDGVRVQRLTPPESVALTPPDRDNFILDESTGKIYVLYGLPRKPGLGQLLTYSLD